jgi:hypothetical protein
MNQKATRQSSKNYNFGHIYILPNFVLDEHNIQTIEVDSYVMKNILRSIYDK